MDVQKAIDSLRKNQADADARFNAKVEWLLKSQADADARFSAKFDRAEERFHEAEARLDRLENVVRLNNRVVTRLVRYGVSLRSDVRRLTQAQAVTDRALRTLIQTMTHRNGRT